MEEEINLSPIESRLFKKPRLIESVENNIQSNVNTGNSTSNEPAEAQKIMSNRKSHCMVCNKRLGLLPFKCKCGGVSCSRHRWPDHLCTFDYRAQEREQLHKNNPVVVADKILRF